MVKRLNALIRKRLRTVLHSNALTIIDWIEPVLVTMGNDAKASSTGIFGASLAMDPSIRQLAS